MLTRALASLAALRHRPARARAFVRPTMRLHLAVLGLLASCAVPAGAMESRFGRKIDLDVLEADMLVGEVAARSSDAGPARTAANRKRSSP